MVMFIRSKPTPLLTCSCVLDDCNIDDEKREPHRGRSVVGQRNLVCKDRCDATFLCSNRCAYLFIYRAKHLGNRIVCRHVRNESFRVCVPQCTDETRTHGAWQRLVFVRQNLNRPGDEIGSQNADHFIQKLQVGVRNRISCSKPGGKTSHTLYSFETTSQRSAHSCRASFSVC
jgi:hypothetical protein